MAKLTSSLTAAFIGGLLFTSACNPETFDSEIKGFINDNNTNTQVCLTDIHFKTKYDSTIVKGNHFVLPLHNIEEGFYNIIFKNSTREGNITGWFHPATVYLKKGKKYTFYSKNKDSLLYNRYTIKSDCEEQRELEEFNRSLNTYFDSLSSEKTRLASLRDEASDTNMYNKYHDSLLTIENLLMRSYKTSVHNLIKKNNNTTIILPYLIGQMNDFFTNYEMYKASLDKLSYQTKRHPETKKAYKKLETAKKLHIGAPLPDFHGTDSSGKSIDYDFSDKKLVLVDFWASWCRPCREANPKLIELYNKYHHKGFDIIGISMDQNLDKWKKALKQDQLPWTNVCEGRTTSNSRNYEDFNANYLPLNFLVSGNREIIAKDIPLDSIPYFMDQ